MAVEDYDRVIEEFERAKALYGNSEETLFHTYLAEAATGNWLHPFLLETMFRIRIHEAPD